jgi:hypothetical protein
MTISKYEKSIAGQCQRIIESDGTLNLLLNKIIIIINLHYNMDNVKLETRMTIVRWKLPKFDSQFAWYFLGFTEFF